jgi:hypothetical protein
MSNSYVQVPPNSSGVKLQTFENTISANVVDAEAMVPVDPAGLTLTANPGSAAPTSGIQVVGSDGTDARAIATDTGGQVKVLVENSPTVAAEITGHAGAVLDGTAGTPSTGVLTVQGVSGGTVIPVANTPAAGAIFEVSPTTAANTKTNPFFEAVSDGTNGPAAVKAASTAAVATDPALVVALSPNTGVVQGAAAANTAGWPVTAGGLAEATAAWTSATPVNTALQINTAGFGTALVTLSMGSTLTGGVLTFEVSDTTAFTNPYSITGFVVTNSTNVTSSQTLSGTANTNIGIAFNVAGWAAFRVRISTVIGGTATVSVGIAASSQLSPTLTLQQVNTAIATIKSSIAQAVVSDNLLNTNFIPALGAQANPVSVADSVYGGAFSGTANTALQGWSKRRASTIFKTVSASATASGNTAVWTPGSGNKFRLLGFQITAQGLSATTAGLLTVSFQDSTTGITFGTYDVDVPAAAGLVTGVSSISMGWVPCGDFGILSATANNVLNFNVSATLSGATGTFRINVSGTEE